MLTSCPKCGFSQPKDQYCAQCGVDMAAYRAPEKSLFQKLSENLFVQLGLVLLAGIVAVYMITKNQKESFWGRMQFLRGNSTQISQSQDANQFSSAAINDEPASEPKMEVVASDTVAVTAKNIPVTKSDAKIIYLEIPQIVLGKWLEEGILTRVETSGEITIGYIPHFSAALEQYKAQIKILKEESYQYSLNQLYSAKLEKSVAPETNPNAARAVASTNTESSMQVPGLMAYATLDDDRNDTLTGQLEISTGPQNSFPAQFEMTSDQSFFISGFDRTKSADRASTHETIVVFKIDK